MMNKDIFADAVEWRPQVGAERRAKIERHRERFSAPAAMFRRLRQTLGLSQVEAALRLGTTQANVSKIEKKATTDLGQLRKLAAGSDYEIVVLLRSKDREIELAD